MSDTTYTTILDRELDEIPGLGWKFTGTATISGSTVTTTDPVINQLGANADANRFATLFLYIPTGTVGTDQTHSIDSHAVSGGTTTITTLGTYAATYSAASMYLLAIHPDILRRINNQGMEDIFTDCFIPLGHGPTDWDMNYSDATYWTGANATIAKQTTATEVFTGPRSLSITATDDGGYAQSGLVNVGQGQGVTLHAILKADTGTATVAVLDGSSNVQASVATTQEEWVYITKQVTMDAADEQARIRVTETTNADQADVSSAWLVKRDDPVFMLPSWVDARFKFKDLSYATYRRAGSESDTWLALSRVETRIDGGYYHQTARQGDANPYMLEFTEEGWSLYGDKPLFMTILCPYSALYGVDTTFTSADTSTTKCPPHQLVPKVKELIGERYEASFPGLMAKGKAKFDDATKARDTEKAPLEEWHGPSRVRL